VDVGRVNHSIVIPANAGIPLTLTFALAPTKRDPRFRGGDEKEK
jgi:hypothetical protein